MSTIGNVKSENPLARYDKGRKSGRYKVKPIDNTEHRHSNTKDSVRKKAIEHSTMYVDSIHRTADVELSFALRLYKLSALWVEILAYLHRHNGVYIGNFSDFTVALGRNPGPKGDTPNIRKCCLELVLRNLITIDYAGNGWPVLFKLNSDWMAMI